MLDQMVTATRTAKKKLHVPHTFLYCDVLQNNNVNIPS